MKKNHILIIPSTFPGKFTKYSGVFYKEQTKALNHLDAKIGVISPEIVSMRNIYIFLKLYLFGMTYRADFGEVLVYRKLGFNVLPFFENFERKLFASYIAILIEKYIKDNGSPDLIHAHGALWAGDSCLKLKKKYGIQFVITEHSSHVMRGNYSKKRKIILKDIYQESAKLIAVSNQLRKVMERISKREVLLVPNVVNTFEFKKSKQRNPYKLLNINTLSKNKRVDDLIESFAIVKEKYINAELHIIGDGQERNKLEKLVVKLNLSKSVVFHGSIPHHQINNLIEGKGILVSTSEYETFGVTLIEAMAKGLPVVATKCGGPEDFVNKDNGILVDVGDVNGITAAIINIIENYNQYSSDNIANFVELNFGRKSISKKLEEIYSSVINC